jgi:hypothetical protein
MHAPFLVAALSGGLREGIGHVTLVSNPEIIGGESASRVVGLVSTVRNSEETVVVGEDYVGISNKTSIQASSNRIASEALLLCNVRAGELSEDRLRYLVERLRARLDAIQELNEDLPPRATRTVLVSPTLDRWLNLDGLHNLPPYYVSENTSIAVHRSHWTRIKSLASGIAVVAAVTAIIVYFVVPSTKPKKSDDDKTIEAAATSVSDKAAKERENWYQEVKIVEDSLGKSENKDYRMFFKEMDRYIKELENNRSNWPQEHYEKAVVKLKSLLSGIMSKARIEIGTALRQASDKINGPSEELRKPSDGASVSEIINELEALKSSIDNRSDLLRNMNMYERILKQMIPDAATETSSSVSTSATDILSKVLVKKIDDKLNGLLDLEPGFTSDYEWLRTLSNRQENYLYFITNNEDQERIHKLFEAVKRLKDLNEIKIHYTIFSNEPYSLESIDIRVAQEQITTKKINAKTITFVYPINCLERRGDLTFNYKDVFSKIPGAGPLVFNYKFTVIGKGSMIEKIITPVDQRWQCSFDWSQDSQNPDIEGLMKLKTFAPKSKSDKDPSGGSR